MACRRGCTRPAYSEVEQEIHKYVGTPCWMDGGPYYPADRVNAGVAMLIGKINALENKNDR